MKFKMFLVLMLSSSGVFAQVENEPIPVIPPTTVVTPPVTPPPPPVTPPVVTPAPGVIVVPTPTVGTTPGGITIVDPTTGKTIVIQPENPTDPSFHQEETFVFFSTGNKVLKKGFYGFKSKGKLSAVERPITVGGTVVYAVCGLNSKELKGSEYLVVNGVVSQTPLCTYNKNRLTYNTFISQTLYKGDQIAIWTKNSASKKHNVILKLYNSNLGE